MKSLFLILVVSCTCSASAQQKGPEAIAFPPRDLLCTGVLFPLGDFSSTHVAGISAGYLFRPGKINPLKKIAFAARTGVQLYAGKKETVSGYPYRYPVYSLLYVQGGALMKITNKAGVYWMAGPGLGWYEGTARLTVISSAAFYYAITRKVAAGPAINWIKETGSVALWSGGLQATFRFVKNK